IPVLYYEQHFAVKEICGILGIKKSLVYKSLDLYRTYGVAHNPHSHNLGWKCLLTVTDTRFLYSLLAQRHCSYLDELQDELFEQCGVWTSTPTLLRTLHCLHFSRKCVSPHAIKCNDLQCSHFMLQIGMVVHHPDMIMFVDEAAKNEQTNGWRYGWSLKGRRCIQRRVFVHGQ
ncbi:hypothetical protein L208DRAFT_1324036, partial [Tricholoma matsutake]